MSNDEFDTLLLELGEFERGNNKQEKFGGYTGEIATAKTACESAMRIQKQFYCCS